MTVAHSVRPQLQPPPLIEAEDAADQASAVFLDARGPEAYQAGHFPGAVRLPVERWEAAAKEPATGLDVASFWEAQIGSLGVDGTRPAFIYDDGRWTEAARAWFILQHFGAPVRIVNGGWPHLKSFGLGVDGARPPAAAVPFRAKSGTGQVGLADRASVRDELGSETRILDARSYAEFTGRDLRKNPRGGHLPGAVLVPHTMFIVLDGRLLPPEVLQEVFLSAGFSPGDSIVTHCDGGGRAALAAVALLQAGFHDVRNCYLSFADWARDETCPVQLD